MRKRERERGKTKRIDAPEVIRRGIADDTTFLTKDKMITEILFHYLQNSSLACFISTVIKKKNQQILNTFNASGNHR